MLQVILSLLIAFFIAFLVQQINDRYGLTRVRTKLPFAIYIIIIGGFTSMHTLHPVMVAAIFSLLGINSLFAVFNNQKPQSELFNAGLFIAIGSLFYFNLLVLLPAFLIAISILRRERKLTEFLILFIGFIFPVLFALSYSFFTNQLTEDFINLQKNIFSGVNHFKTNYPLQGFLAVLIIITIVGSFKIVQQYDTRKISVRKFYSSLFVIFSFSIFGFLFIPATSHEMLVISALPLTFLISNLFATMKQGFWAEFLFTLFLGASIAVQFAERLIQSL